MRGCPLPRRATVAPGSSWPLSPARRRPPPPPRSTAAGGGRRKGGCARGRPVPTVGCGRTGGRCAPGRVAPTCGGAGDWGASGGATGASARANRSWGYPQGHCPRPPPGLMAVSLASTRVDGGGVVGAVRFEGRRGDLTLGRSSSRRGGWPPPGAFPRERRPRDTSRGKTGNDSRAPARQRQSMGKKD